MPTPSESTPVNRLESVDAQSLKLNQRLGVRPTNNNTNNWAPSSTSEVLQEVVNKEQYSSIANDSEKCTELTEPSIIDSQYQ